MRSSSPHPVNYKRQQESAAAAGTAASVDVAAGAVAVSALLQARSSAPCAVIAPQAGFGIITFLLPLLPLLLLLLLPPSLI